MLQVNTLVKIPYRLDMASTLFVTTAIATVSLTASISEIRGGILRCSLFDHFGGFCRKGVSIIYLCHVLQHSLMWRLDSNPVCGYMVADFLVAMRSSLCAYLKREP
jgi:hypothetical protein